jgi:hypothetical protein
MTLHGE